MPGLGPGEQPFARGCRRVDPTATAQSSTLPCIGRRAQVVVLALGANDGLRRGDIRSMTAPLDAIIRQAQGAGAEVVLAGMEAPAAHGAAYTSALRNAFRQLAAAHRLALMPFLLDGVALDPALNQADGEPPQRNRRRDDRKPTVAVRRRGAPAARRPGGTAVGATHPPRVPHRPECSDRTGRPCGGRRTCGELPRRHHWDRRPRGGLEGRLRRPRRGRRRRAPARDTGSVGAAKEELAVPKDGSPISELSVDAAAPREPVAEAAAAVGGNDTRRAGEWHAAVLLIAAAALSLVVVVALWSAVAQRVHARRADTRPPAGRRQARS